MLKMNAKHHPIIFIGNFFFRYRDLVFPVYIGILFFLFSPPIYAVNGSEFYEMVRDVIGVTCALLGLFVRAMVIGFAYIQRGGLNKKVYAESLVTQGIFALCRNPLYVGNMLIYLGIFLMFGHLLCLAIGILSFAFIYFSIVATEEKFLKEKFGEEYESYCKQVPRWIPRLSLFKEAVREMHFDWRKVIERDHGTICATLGVLVLIEFWEVLAAYGFKDNEIYVLFLSALCLILILSVFLARWLKKSGFLGD
jgi:protein-S-isoprenylcysteine O-methyltransferase Ste14